ncbi:MAG: hypothetical protein AB9856_03610 [Cellulosilyticaceae bacterium]
MDTRKKALHSECQSCIKLVNSKCKGKTSNIPCLGYKSKEQHMQEVIKGIKSDLAKRKE